MSEEIANNKDDDNNNNKEAKDLLISEKKIESIKSVTFVMSRKIRWFIFFLFIIINLLMNYDHGTVPAATEQLRKYLDLTDSELGFFGSLVFIGVIIGSLISLSIINIFNRKYILMVCLILCGFSLFAFTITKKYVLLCIDRVIVGIFQAFISIYLPLWCDQFGIERRKAIMIALIQVAPPLGVLVGYIVTTVLNMHLKYLPIFGHIEKNARWIYSFYIQAILIWILSFCLIFFSDKYFNSNARRVPLKIDETLNSYENKNSGSERKLSFFYEGNENLETLEEENDFSEKDDNENCIELSEKTDTKKEEVKMDKKEEKEEMSFCAKLKIIFSEPLFICCVLTLCILYFIVTCIQYWTSDYMLVALEVKEETKRLYAFSIVCLTSPTCGLLISGLIIDKIGGYSNKYSLIFSLIVSILSIVPAILLPLVNSLLYYAILLWIILFFGGSLLPPIQGITIVCLPKKLQGSGTSFVIFFYNLLGYLPAPFAYGFLKDYFNDKNDPKKGSRMAQKITIWITFLAGITIGIATIFRFSKDEKYNKIMGRDKTKSNEEEDDLNPIRVSERSSNTVY